MKVFKIGLRLQLVVLVLIVSLFSLTVLSVITGVYFSANFRNMRSDRLAVIAQMKASQVQQNLNYLYYQAYWLGVRDPLQTSLVSYRAGNNSESNWDGAKDVIMQFLTSSNTFTNVKVYDSKFKNVVTSESNWSNAMVPDDILASLYPLDSLSGANSSIPINLDQQGLLTGPVLNHSDYVMSMTIPVYASASIIVQSQDLAGYFTVVMSAQSLSSTLNLTEATVVLIGQGDSDNLMANSNTYKYMLVPWNNSAMNDSFNLSDSYPATQVLRYGRSGATASTKSETGVDVAAGYSPVDFNLTQWGVIIEQKKNVFLEPMDRLTKILVGVCIGTASLIVLCTFPLAHWATQPILRLQKATETIAMGRGLQNSRDPKDPSSGYSSSRHSFSQSQQSPYNNTSENLTQPVSPITAINKTSSNTSSPSNHHHPTYIGEARVPKYTRFFQDELSKLTDTFNTMTDELDRQYSQLEDRVRARTKQLEAAKIQAEAANEAKTVFIANISHELRTPLNGILGMTAIAMAENDQNKIQESLKLIFRSGELLLHILTELLTFSKNSLKRSKLEKSNFNPTEVALQIKSIFAKLAKDQHVNLQITISPNDVRKMILYGDSNRIIQVVMNLVSNALKFTPVDGSVKVTINRVGEYDEEKSAQYHHTQVFVKDQHIYPSDNTALQKFTKKKSEVESPTSSETVASNDDILEERSEDDELDNKSIITASTSSYDDNVFKSRIKTNDFSVDGYKVRELEQPKTYVFEIIVEDTGPGIEQKFQEKVFEPFVQGDQSLSRQYGGTGLGLSICRQLATMMQGVLTLESEVGVGSKFTFRLPLLQTMEIIVDDDDVNFYDDQFNVDSKRNRKVQIIDPKSDIEDDGHMNRDSIPTENETEHTDVQCNSSEQNHGITPNLSENSYFNRPLLLSTGTAKSSINSSSSSKGSELNGSHLRVLVAEDNSVNQEVIKRMLNLEGLKNLDIATDGADAIRYVKSCMNGDCDTPGLYDIIFMDVQMPNVDGLQATKTIREMGFVGPIVALTAFADESNVKVCLEAGMSGFLSKPIRRSKLRSVMVEFFPGLVRPAVTTPGE